MSFSVLLRSIVHRGIDVRFAEVRLESQVLIRALGTIPPPSIESMFILVTTLENAEWTKYSFDVFVFARRIAHEMNGLFA